MENEFPTPQSAETTTSKEKLEAFPVKVFVTDHSADHEDTGNTKSLRALYTDIKKDGVDSIRFDWRWNNVQPTNEEIDQTVSGRYKEAISLMQEAGLEDPTVNISSIPGWAFELYKTDKEAFFNAYGHYLESVLSNLQAVPDVHVSKFQILNELNVSTYTPIKDVQDIGKMCDMVREKFKDYNPNLEISVSLLAAEFPDVIKGKGLAEDIGEYLDRFPQIKDHVDTITLDYYPGSWQRPAKEGVNQLQSLFTRVLAPGKDAYKEMFTEMGLFKSVAERMSSMGINYEIGETGFPTKDFYWGNQERQRYFYDAFSRSLKHLMVDFRENGTRLPSRIGYYEAIDEKPRDLTGEALKRTPYPEFDWGMRTVGGDRKSILQGQRGNGGQGESQFSRIIKYLRSPMKSN